MRSVYMQPIRLVPHTARRFWKARKPIALIRSVFITLLGHEGEICQRCGGGYSAFCWHARQSLWTKAVGSTHGCFCPRCFTKLCKRVGITPIFVAEPWIIDGKQDEELAARVWDGYVE